MKKIYLVFVAAFGLWACSNSNKQAGLSSEDNIIAPRTISELLKIDSLSIYANPLRGYDYGKMEQKTAPRIFSIGPVMTSDMSCAKGLCFSVDVKGLPSDSVTMMLPLLNNYMKVFMEIYLGNMTWNYSQEVLEYQGIINVLKSHDAFNYQNYTADKVQFVHRQVPRSLEQLISSINNYPENNDMAIKKHVVYFDSEIASDSILSMDTESYRISCNKAATDTLTIMFEYKLLK